MRDLPLITPDTIWRLSQPPDAALYPKTLPEADADA